jgi:hypothetical protein
VEQAEQEAKRQRLPVSREQQHVFAEGHALK